VLKKKSNHRKNLLRRRIKYALRERIGDKLYKQLFASIYQTTADFNHGLAFHIFVVFHSTNDNSICFLVRDTILSGVYTQIYQELD